MIKLVKSIFYRHVFVIFLSCIITLIVVFTTNRYQLKNISYDISNINTKYVFHDLDRDGESEKIRYINYQELKAELLVYKKDKIIGDWEFNGQFGGLTENIIDDYDNDGIDEIFLFIINNDSLFLNCIDCQSRQSEFGNIPICSLTQVNHKYQYDFAIPEPADINSDGTKEIIFSINAGYTIQPRGIYIYYPQRKLLLKSASGCVILHNPVLFDLDKDNGPEILCDNIAAGNCRKEAEYSDSLGWIMVFTTALTFKFPPVRLDESPAETKVIPFKSDNDNRLMVLHCYKGSGRFDSFIALYDFRGMMVKKRLFPREENMYNSYLLPFENNFSQVGLFSNSGVVYRIDKNLNLIERAKVENINPDFPPLLTDIDLDGNKEILLMSTDESTIRILRHDFSNPVSFTFLRKPLNIVVSLKKESTKKPVVVIETYDGLYFFDYDLSVIRKYWFILWIAVLLICYGSLYIFVKIREFRKIRTENYRNQLAELQLKSVQNQIDPHFTFNLLESFGSLINEHDTKRAEYIFNKYSSLLKSTVLNGDKILIPLREELDFIISYLDLEKFRYGNKFDYELNIDPGLDTNISIPKMLLHIFVENAVKHGLKHLDNNTGMLELHVLQKDNSYEITISDNGIGRKKAAEIRTFSTGKGLKIVESMLDLNYNMFKKKIAFEVEDLSDDGLHSGTRVKINIPL